MSERGEGRRVVIVVFAGADTLVRQQEPRGYRISVVAAHGHGEAVVVRTESGLALVEDDHSADIAQEVARWLVVLRHRPGGQSQYATPTWTPRGRHVAVRAAQEAVEVDPGGDRRVPVLAAGAAMSERHFTRLFTTQVGIPPGRYVERVRVEAAREALETSAATVEAIAAGCGLGTGETLRRVFRRHLGVAPDAYRQRSARHPRPAGPLRGPPAPARLRGGLPGCAARSGAQRGQVRTENAMLGLSVDATFEEVTRPDVVVLPGGVGTRALIGDQAVLDWLRTAHQSTMWTTSVCTGSLVLGTAGLLRGLRVTARAMQLMVEYDPQPPFDAGSIAKSDQATIDRARQYAALRE